MQVPGNCYPKMQAQENCSYDNRWRDNFMTKLIFWCDLVFISVFIVRFYSILGDNFKDELCFFSEIQ